MLCKLQCNSLVFTMGVAHLGDLLTQQFPDVTLTFIIKTAHMLDSCHRALLLNHQAQNSNSMLDPFFSMCVCVEGHYFILGLLFS